MTAVKHLGLRLRALVRGGAAAPPRRQDEDPVRERPKTPEEYLESAPSSSVYLYEGNDVGPLSE